MVFGVFEISASPQRFRFDRFDHQLLFPNIVSVPTPGLTYREVKLFLQTTYCVSLGCPSMQGRFQRR